MKIRMVGRLEATTLDTKCLVREQREGSSMTQSESVPYLGLCEPLGDGPSHAGQRNIDIGGASGGGRSGGRGTGGGLGNTSRGRH